MQKINLIAQSVLKLSHRENADNDNDNDDDDTHPGWIIVRVGMYSVADKNRKRQAYILRVADGNRFKTSLFFKCLVRITDMVVYNAEWS